MPTIDAVKYRLENFNIIWVIADILSSQTKFIDNLIKNQWLHGEAQDDMPLGQYASKPYAIYKNEKNSLPGFGFIDLIDTGATIDSLQTEVTDDSLVYNLQSDRNELLDRFGERILGLNYQSRLKLIEFVSPLLTERIKLIFHD